MEVFAFAQRRTTVTTCRGAIAGLDRTINEAGVRAPDGHVVNVAVDARDALECVQELVALSGDELWLECEHFEGVACSFHLVVEPEKFDHAVSAGLLEAEEALITLATAVWRDARIPTGLVETEGDGGGAVVPEEWCGSYPPYAYQKATVAWMLNFEQTLPRPITYDGNLKITDVWYVDTESQALTKESSPREAALSGGICADGLGCGKTATALLLAHQKPPEVSEEAQYASRGTLFILPINLLAQWRRECAKFLPNVDSLWISEARDLKHISLQDLCDAQMTFTTFELLRSNSAYQAVLEEALQGRPRERAALGAWARKPGRTAPLLEAVYWTRVVVDEMHHVLDSARDLKTLRLFRYSALWGLTGTPVLEGDGAQSLYLLLQRDKGHHPALLATVMRTAVRSGGVSALAPGAAQHRVELVKLSAEERVSERDAHLLSLSEQVKRLSSGAEPEDAGQLRLKALRVQEAAAERNLNILQRASQELQTELQRCCEQCDTPLGDVATSTREACESQAKDVVKATEVLSRLKRKREAWELRAMDSQKRLAEMKTSRLCQICGDRAELIGPRCLHLACAICAAAHDGYCPLKSCNEALVTMGRHDEHGCTKLAQLGKHLASLPPDEGVLLFVQFRSLLRQTRAFLRKFGLTVHTLDGNTRARASALSALSAGGVLLLCLEDGFAGLHLPEIRHVVFAHAIVGPVERVRTLERQAISRCLRPGQQRQVQVTSYVCSETEEFVLYDATHPK